MGVFPGGWTVVPADAPSSRRTPGFSRGCGVGDGADEGADGWAPAFAGVTTGGERGRAIVMVREGGPATLFAGIG